MAGKAWRYLEEKLCALLHDLLDLEEAGRVHEQELVSHVHAEAAGVAEGQDLLETLRLHRGGQLHHRALPPGVKQVPEIRAAGCQHRAVGLRETPERVNTDRFLLNIQYLNIYH